MVKTVVSEEITDINRYFNTSPDKFFTCRLYGHVFRPTHKAYLPEGDPHRPTALVKKLQCLGCASTATDTFHPRTLERLGSRSIVYVEGYLAKGTRISRLDARVWEAFESGVTGSTKGRRRKKAS